MRRSGWSEDLAGVAVLELDDLAVDLHVANPRRRALTSRHVPIGCLCRNSRQTAGLAGAGVQHSRSADAHVDGH